MIEPIYGQIVFTGLDPVTNEPRQQIFQGLFSSKGKISTPEKYDRQNFLGIFDLGNLEKFDQTRGFNLAISAQADSAASDRGTNLPITELIQREAELLDLLENQEFVDSRFLFSTYQTSEVYFHG